MKNNLEGVLSQVKVTVNKRSYNIACDELSDSYTELETIKSADEGAVKLADQQEAISISLDIIAKRIERVAETVEAA